MIILQGLTKSYRTSSGRHYIFKDLNLTIPDNKSVALIGRNGAGKSTLLRLMGGIDKPDQGKVISDKSISWPVGFGGSFQGSMTGRENVRFVCRLYAKEEEIPEKIAFIETFAGLGKYFDMPVKTYSSGMRSRLAFGLSMGFDFDYYLMDEITAVGDADFKLKCAKLMKRKRKKANFIMATHKTRGIRRYCDMVLFLGRSGIRLFDDIDEGIAAYDEELASLPSSSLTRKERRHARRAGIL